MKKIKFFFFFIIFLINNNFVKTQITKCIYVNDVNNQTYDLNPLIKNTDFYSKGFKTFGIGADTTFYFSFCRVTVDPCKQRACQDNNNAGNLNVEEIVTFNDTGIVMTTHYKTNNLGGTNCLAASPSGYRNTYIKLSCDPNEEFKIISMKENGYCVYEVEASSKYLCRTCPFDCSNHGLCGPHDGICQCDTQTNGDFCQNSKLFIGSSDSAPEETGGVINIYGYFGQITSNAKVLIGDQECKNPIVYRGGTFDTIQCTIGPGKGTKDILFTDRDLKVLGVNAFRYTPKAYECLKNCSKQGVCDTTTGICKCSEGFAGPDCLSTGSNSTTGVGGDGSSSIGNSNTTFTINIHSLVEFKFDGNVHKEHILYNKWKQISTTNTTNSIITTFNQIIPNTGCVVEYSVEQVLNHPKDYFFANQNFTLDPNSLKVTVSIHSYKYNSTLNSLQLRILSLIGDEEDSNVKCKQETDFDTDGINSLHSSNYITISRENKIFYGRFLSSMLSDLRVTYMSTQIVSKDQDSLLIGLNMPHCINECIIDPDFSLLVSSKSNDRECESKREWFLPVVIIAPTVGAALIVIISAVIYKRYRTNLKIAAAALKLNNLN
ncbi:hypothetical protein DICPUDRAFT_55625 [Dictyostelium purpureum]|uniref:Uncharacterized protein n=1 Tax=Dictyostelium purpureum TaxID=5786 RepID=F0ZMZ3_DICPU|nr:uncharacterized protein DICPUDRAFT_55625 [Dictyostelium purpureum]EGC34704.1 hypothetical protein DICPUDRAFT_55625 [Dictyostelium purpureum]|eukprot:XP_003288789.1 hypothetical protein DICPUDRAFT_55625 [Dictyostelium purpureum]